MPVAILSLSRQGSLFVRRAGGLFREVIEGGPLLSRQPPTLTFIGKWREEMQ
jgi:hypothetical protein